MYAFDLLKTLLVSIFLTAVVLPTHAQDWSQFRGPSFGKHSDSSPPVRWSSENTGWKTKLPGPGASSPVTFGDRIYLTCYSGYGVQRGNPGEPKNLKRHVLCINSSNGKVAWEKKIGAKSSKNQYTQWAVALHGYASSSPVVDESGVYLYLGDAGCVAFDHDGKQRWTFDCGDRTHMFGSGASPVLYKDLVIVNACPESGSLIAINKKSGKEVWRQSNIKQSWSTPAIYLNSGGSSELAISMAGKVVAYKPEDGSELWSCPAIQGYVCPSIVVQDAIVYSIGGKNQKKAVAVRSGGTDDVAKSHKLWELNKGSNVGSPVVHDGHMYWAKEDGIVYCVDLATGNVIYEKRLEPKSGLVYASPLLSNGNLYYVSRENGTYVVAAKPEFELVAHNVIEGDESIFNASPIPSGAGLLLRSDHYLYQIVENPKQ
ncbi:PQQ-binding-like beta-propeller repeat protein [Vicingaceae bacterium]|nr:PQQ-binding-like beta-propeller repeat protein [Vicingaceae bacterium]